MQTCPKCSAVNNPDSKFCYACGNPFSSMQQTPSIVNVQPDQPAQPLQPATPVQHTTPVQPATPTQPTTPVQPSQPYSSVPPMQQQQANPSFTPVQNQSFSGYTPVQPNSTIPTYQQNPGQFNPMSPYVTPPKKNNNVLIALGGGIAAIVLVLFLVLKFTSLGSSIMALFGGGGSKQFVHYYNEIHAPIYQIELQILNELNSTLLLNNYPDLDYVYQVAPQWKSGFDDVKRRYANAEVANDEIKEVNDLSIQRTITMEYALGRLIDAIKYDDVNIYNNEFIVSVNEYNSYFAKWDEKVQALAKKYNLKFE